MQRIVLDTNAVIMHGRSFPERARSAAKQGKSVILPSAVKTELVDDVLTVDDAPANHRESAQTIQNLVDEGILTVREPDFDKYGTIADEARKRIADESLPEHAVKADQYIPALVCELATEGNVCLVTADAKLRDIVADIASRRGLADAVRIREPTTVL